MALCRGAYMPVDPVMTDVGERCVCPECGATWDITRRTIPGHDDGRPSVWSRTAKGTP